jgi:hypothetical protein
LLLQGLGQQTQELHLTRHAGTCNSMPGAFETLFDAFGCPFCVGFLIHMERLNPKP